MKKLSLAETHPDLLKEWDYERNTLSPNDVTKGSHKRVWWMCKQGHEWEAIVKNRTSGRGCRKCSHLRGEPLDASLVAEWHPSKNTLSPQDVTRGSAKKAWWFCKKGHEWEAKVKSRSDGYGCPVCAYNRGEPISAELAAEWHPTKNKMPASDVSRMSEKKVWWLCKKGHEWEAEVRSRTNGNGCRKCSHLRGEPLDASLVAEWHPSKNTLSPQDVTRGSAKKAWWVCPRGHEWEAEVKNRSDGCGCPNCKTSKGEKSVAKTLETLGLKHKPQFPLRYTKDGKRRCLRFDFAVAKGLKRGLIEYQGKQHYVPVKYWKGEAGLDGVQHRDHLKREACRNLGVPLLEIPYWDFDKIDALVTEFIEKL